jgi:hypothetical protein
VAKPASELVTVLRKRSQVINRHRLRVESLYAQKKLSKHAVNDIITGLFLQQFTAFENFLEELFLGLLVEGKGYTLPESKCLPRIRVKSYNIARTLLTRGSNYTNWLPYENNILKLAKVFFRAGRPFTSLPKNLKENLDAIGYIRNVIAHRSRYSMDKFNEKLIGGAVLPVSEQSPSGFLRGIITASPPQTRFENYAGQLIQIANAIVH